MEGKNKDQVQMITIEQIHNGEGLHRCARLMSGSDPWITLGYDTEKCMVSLKGEYKEIYEARVNGEFAGFVILFLAGILRGYIQSICVHPEFRNKGIGTQLIRFSEERISAISPNVFMCVSSFNHRAQALYQRLGFEKVGELKDHFSRGHNEIILRKSSGPVAEFQPQPAATR